MIRFKNSHIPNVIFFCMVLVSSLSIIAIGLLWIKHEKTDFQDQTKLLKSSYQEGKKAELKDLVDQTIKYINYKRSLTRKRLKHDINKRVYEAHEIVENIYQNNVGERSREEIIQIVKQSLRPVRFFDNRNYYFIDDLKGNSVLYPPKPSFEGNNLMHITNKEGIQPFPEIIKLVKEKGEGFYTYNWVKYTEGNATEEEFPKITFFKLFEPYNWFIGVGEYLDYIENDVIQEILDRTALIKNKDNDFIDIHTSSGVKLVSNGLKLKNPANEWELTTGYGYKLVQELKAIVESKKSGFVQYDVKGSIDRPVRKKVTYVSSIPEWGWLISAGSYFDKTEKIIEEKKATLLRENKENILYIVFIMTGFWLFSLFVARYISFKINAGFTIFSEFFTQASSSLVKIDKTDVSFAEFNTLAKLANQMVEKTQQAEASLRNSEEKYRMMIERSNDMIWTLDVEGNFTFFNEQTQKIAGLKPKDWIGESCIPLILKEDVEMINEVFRKSIKGKAVNYELRFQKPDGDILTISVNTAPVLKDGKVKSIVSFGRDITEQRELEYQVQQAQKMESIGTLAGGIAHDFNNILFPILGYSEMLLEDIPEDSSFKANVHEIYIGAVRAKELVEQILTFSRQEKNEIKLMKVQPLLKEALKMIRSTIPTTINIRHKIDSACGPIKADPIQIHQIIMNLTTNAYHAMEDHGGTMNVTFKEKQFKESDLFSPNLKEGSYACLTVKDNGVGMAEDMVEKIFDPFFTTKEKGKGTGMGLSMVHGIVSKTGGAIQVLSKPGKGTRFDVYFPTQKAAYSDQGIQVQNSIQGGSEKLLIVDDEKGIISMESQMLKRLGYEVVPQASSLEALEMFREQAEDFNLVITDLAMPDMPGDELAFELKKIKPEIPIILCTGFSEKMTQEEARKIGINAVLLKPIVMKDLAAKIRSVLESASLG